MNTRPTPTLLILAATLMAPLAALAAPVESADLVLANGGPIASRGNVTNTTAGEPNTILNITPTSSATVRSVMFSGTVAKVKSGTFASEARIGLTRPGGTEVLLQPIARTSFTTTHDVVMWRYILPADTAANAGAWTFRFYESFIDTGAGPDSNWTTLSAHFDDSALPAGIVNLGTLDGTTSPIVHDGTVAANAVTWYRFTTTTATTNPNFVDIHTLGSALAPTNDTAMAVFNATTGARVASNDNWQSSINLLSGMAFSSSTAGPRTRAPYTTNFTSQSGNLPAGDYLLAVFAGPSVTSWSATSTLVRTDGFNVGSEFPAVISGSSGASRVTLITSGGSVNPAGVGAVTPATVLDGGSTLYTVTVTPGGNPTSTNLAVTADFTAIGGSPAVALFNDGTNGDLTAGDAIWSLGITVPVGTAPGVKALPFTITDGQSRSGTGSVNLTVAAIPAAEDLGTLSGATPALDATVTLANNQVKWYRFTLAEAADASRFVDISTAPSVLTPTNDTEIGLYRADGTLVVSNDDSGTGGVPNNFLSLLSFGQAAPARSYLATSTNSLQAATGQDGATLPAGTYYLSVSSFNTTFASVGFGVASTGTNTGPASVLIRTNSTAPTPPTGNMVLTPAVVLEGVGMTALLTVPTFAGTNPPSTGITVTADLTSIGGSATAQMFDDGTNGDVTTGDGTYSLSYTVPVATTSGVKSIPFTVSDAQARSSAGAGSLTVTPVIDLGTLTSSGITNNTGTIVANGVVWYRVNLPEATADTFVDMHTIGSEFTGGGTDSELGMYTAAGTLVASNDDFGGTALSALSFGGTAAPARSYLPFAADLTGQTAGTLTAGTYYLAAGKFNVNFLANFNVNSTGGASGTIVINLFSNTTPPVTGCNVADIVAIGGNPPPDGLLTGDDFNTFIAAFAANDLLADVVAIGGNPPGDGLITGDDFNAFIAAFAAGCP